VLLAVLAYIPAFDAGWVWDDDDYVTENRELRSLEGLGRIWFEFGAVPQYYPLVHTTFWLEYRLWGTSAAGYHAVNIALHALAAMLAWRLMRRLGLAGAWVAAAIFAVHPVHVESVAWVTERKNVLSAVFYLGSFLMFLRFRPTGEEEPKGLPAYAGALALFAGALLAKTVTASLPAAILVVAWWKQGRLTARSVVPTLPMFGMGVVAASVTVWMERSHVGAVGPTWDLSWIERSLIASRALLFYLEKLLWPRSLSFVYERWVVEPASPVWWISPLVVGATVLVLYVFRDRIGRGPLAAALLFGGTLFPALGFLDVYPMRFSFVADHFQYLASLAPIAALTAGGATVLSRWAPRSDVLRSVIAGRLTGTLAALTWVQSGLYRDEETLFRDAAEKSPRAFLAHNNLGGILLARGETEGARRHFRAALDAAPDFPEAMVNMGLVEENDGRLREAESWYRRAIDVDPAFADAHNNLGIVLARSGDLEGSVNSFRRAVAHRVAFPKAWYNLGVALLALGREEEAIEALERSVSLEPEESAFRRALERARPGNQGRTDSAIQPR
jgi:tetratricopeptide (TPR) repeat protein